MESFPLFKRLFTESRIGDCLNDRFIFVKVRESKNTADLEHIGVRFLDDFRQVIDIDFSLFPRMTEQPRQGGGFDIVNGVLKLIRVVQMAEIAKCPIETDGRKDRDAVLRNKGFFTEEVKSGGKTARTAEESADKVNMFRLRLSLVIHVLVVDDKSPLIEKKVGGVLEIEKNTTFGLLTRKVNDHLNNFGKFIEIH